MFTRTRSRSRFNGNASTLILVPKPSWNQDWVAPAQCDVAICVKAPSQPIVALVATRWMIYVKHDQIWFAVPVNIGNRNSSTLILVPKPSRNQDRVAPAPSDLKTGVKPPANPVITVITA
jgi:hypothetical protein